MSGTDDFLKPFPWFAPAGKSRVEESVFSALGKVGIGLLVGGFLAYQGFVVAGLVVCAIACTVGVISVVSYRGRVAISAFFGVLGVCIGRVFEFVLLVPTYLIAFSSARLWQWLSGSDPLQMRQSDRRTFWLEPDSSRRKRRYVGTMFATEHLATTKRRLLPAAVVMVMIAIAAELTFRGMGYGHPILYVNDPVIGYYPAPNQDVTRSGGRVSTNQFGMRSPDCSVQKPKGTFRILMIGDSTLYGGSYIDQEELYSRLLEKNLAESVKYKKVEVLSIGVNAWGPFHKLAYIQQKGTFGADLAIICMPIGDIYRPLSGIREMPFLTVDHPPSCAIEEVLCHLMWRYRATIAGKPSKESRETQGQLGIETYVALAQLLRQQGSKVMFEILPSRKVGTGQAIQSEQSSAVQQLRESLATEGFDNFNYPIGLFTGKGTLEELYHDKCHLYRQGHRFYAEYLAQQIKPQIKQHDLGVGQKIQGLMEARGQEGKSGYLRR